MSSTVILALATFQSTLPCGERPTMLSSHHPRVIFQSTLPCGERPLMPVYDKPDQLFQSTLPCGERHESLQFTRSFYDFNPRSRVGSDTPKAAAKTAESKFQSTLPCGERRSSTSQLIGHISISIHAPVWGATTASLHWRVQASISIHAPVWGATG